MLHEIYKKLSFASGYTRINYSENYRSLVPACIIIIIPAKIYYRFKKPLEEPNKARHSTGFFLTDLPYYFSEIHVNTTNVKHMYSYI